MAARYFLSQDCDSHWYIVPVKHAAAWSEWQDLDSDNEKSWYPPAFAIMVGGSPTLVTFEKPKVDE